jgi:hypothetical protein
MLLPIVVFLGLGALLYLSVDRPTNVDGNAIVLLAYVGLSSILVGMWELLAVPFCVYQLLRHAYLRTSANLFALAMGMLYLICLAFFFIYYFVPMRF